MTEGTKLALLFHFDKELIDWPEKQKLQFIGDMYWLAIGIYEHSSLPRREFNYRGNYKPKNKIPKNNMDLFYSAVSHGLSKFKHYLATIFRGTARLNLWEKDIIYAYGEHKLNTLNLLYNIFEDHEITTLNRDIN